MKTFIISLFLAVATAVSFVIIVNDEVKHLSVSSTAVQDSALVTAYAYPPDLPADWNIEFDWLIVNSLQDTVVQSNTAVPTYQTYIIRENEDRQYTMLTAIDRLSPAPATGPTVSQIFIVPAHTPGVPDSLSIQFINQWYVDQDTLMSISYHLLPIEPGGPVVYEMWVDGELHATTVRRSTDLRDWLRSIECPWAEVGRWRCPGTQCRIGSPYHRLVECKNYVWGDESLGVWVNRFLDHEIEIRWIVDGEQIGSRVDLWPAMSP